MSESNRSDIDMLITHMEERDNRLAERDARQFEQNRELTTALNNVALKIATLTEEMRSQKDMMTRHEKTLADHEKRIRESEKVYPTVQRIDNLFTAAITKSVAFCFIACAVLIGAVMYINKTGL